MVNGTLLNFGKKYEDNLRVIFDQWPKLHLGLDAPSNQKILMVSNVEHPGCFCQIIIINRVDNIIVGSIEQDILNGNFNCYDFFTFHQKMETSTCNPARNFSRSLEEFQFYSTKKFKVA
jgi:hypothetical protein